MATTFWVSGFLTTQLYKFRRTTLSCSARPPPCSSRFALLAVDSARPHLVIPSSTAHRMNSFSNCRASVQTPVKPRRFTRLTQRDSSRPGFPTPTKKAISERFSLRLTSALEIASSRSPPSLCSLSARCEPPLQPGNVMIFHRRPMRDRRKSCSSFRRKRRPKNFRAFLSDLLDIRDQNTVFAGLLAHDESVVGLGKRGTFVAPLWTSSAPYFSVRGVLPASGRPFLAEEENGRGQRVASSVIVLAETFARSSGSECLLINGQTYTIVGSCRRIYWNESVFSRKRGCARSTTNHECQEPRNTP